LLFGTIRLSATILAVVLNRDLRIFTITVVALPLYWFDFTGEDFQCTKEQCSVESCC
jgi:hypothetical protein